MKKIVLCLLTLFFFCSGKNPGDIQSPNGDIVLRTRILEGSLFYEVDYRGEKVIAPSEISFRLKDNEDWEGRFQLSSFQSMSDSSVWETVWGERDSVLDRYEGTRLNLINEQGKKYWVEFKVFNDAVAFRYGIPAENGLDSIFLMEEKSEFALTGNPKAWWIPANFDSYESTYRTGVYEDVETANTPVTFQWEDGACLSIHEAALTDFSGMTLAKNDSGALTSRLVPWPDSVLVRSFQELKSPWRVVLLARDPGGLIASTAILNLNEPCKIEDTHWIKPFKYVGIWWGMHLGVETWVEGLRHGATTENSKRYIDFAAENGLGGFLAEGWNTGWDKWGQERAFDQVTPASDFDLKRIIAYCKEKNVEYIGHHETGGDAAYYEELIDSSFQFYKENGVKALKTGYAGGIMPRGQYHHGQFMVRHYRKVVEKAARYGIMINAHEPIKATGIRRTWPNMMTREGAKGMEWNAWSEGNPPEHHTILPFTRLLGGPLDYTPGIFDILLKKYDERRKRWNSPDTLSTRIHTTLAKQLALYVVFYSPWQMASDFPENYQGNPAFEFIRQVPVDWDRTLVLDGEIGDYVVIARKKSGSWFVGGITDENPKELELSFDFLDGDGTYEATFYTDHEETDFEKSPEKIDIFRETVDNKTKKRIALKKSGGLAIRLKKQ